MPNPAPIASAFHVRRAGGTDAAALLPLIYSHAAFERGQATVSVDGLQLLLDGPATSISAWLADTPHGPIGYATATTDVSTWSGAPFLHLDCLFVAKGHRGSGVGAALLAAVSAHARDRHIAEIQWQTPDWNEGAVRFYRREGAQAFAKVRFTLSIG